MAGLNETYILIGWSVHDITGMYNRATLYKEIMKWNDLVGGVAYLVCKVWRHHLQWLGLRGALPPPAPRGWCKLDCHALSPGDRPTGTKAAAVAPTHPAPVRGGTLERTLQQKGNCGCCFCFVGADFFDDGGKRLFVVAVLAQILVILILLKLD